jgi:hypothetical protein
MTEASVDELWVLEFLAGRSLTISLPMAQKTKKLAYNHKTALRFFFKCRGAYA